MDSKPSFIERHVPRDQGRVYARDYKGADPAFVLMHGFPDNLKIYDDLVPYLVASGRRVVAFDFLGFGASDKPSDASYSFGQQLGDLEALVEVLGLDKIIPVGHDASGPAAINFAIEHPDRVASMCILNTFYGAAPAIRLPELIELFATPSLKALATAMAQSPEQLAWLLQFQQKIFKDALSDDQSAYFATFLGPIINDTFMKQPSSGPAFVQMTSHILEEVTRNTKRIPEMEALDMPIKLIWGGNDPYLSTDVAKDFRSHLKQSSLHVIPAGHWLQVDAPAQVAKEMLS
jgi:haloalkane dehalogenase